MLQPKGRQGLLISLKLARVWSMSTISQCTATAMTMTISKCGAGYSVDDAGRQASTGNPAHIALDFR